MPKPRLRVDPNSTRSISAATERVRSAIGSKTRFSGTCITATASPDPTQRRLAQAAEDCRRAAHGKSPARKPASKAKPRGSPQP